MDLAATRRCCDQVLSNVETNATLACADSGGHVRACSVFLCSVLFARTNSPVENRLENTTDIPRKLESNKG